MFGEGQNVRPASGKGETARLSGQMSMSLDRSQRWLLQGEPRRDCGEQTRAAEVGAYSLAGSSMSLFTASVASYTDTCTIG